MDLFESFSEEITKWDVLKDEMDLDLTDEFNEDSKAGPRVQLLPRKSLNIYGNIPKMEQRIFSKCKECRLIFNPRNILSHKTCLGRTHSSSSFDLKKKSKSKSSKKSHSNTPSSPSSSNPVVSDVSKVVSPKISKLSSSSTSSSPNDSSGSPHKSSSRVSSGTSNSKTNSPLILKSPKPEHSSNSSSKLSKLFHNSDTSSISTSTSKLNSSSSHSSGSSSSLHKKSRKSSTSISRSTEEYNPSIHCGVIEDNKGPCTRSLSCSSHRSQLRKLITSRNKEVQYLLNERKVSKEKETKHSSSKSHHNFPNDLETKDPGESYVPALAKSNTLSILLPKTSDSFINHNLTTSNKQVLDITDFDIKFPKCAEVLFNNDSDAGIVPIVCMPMSPVSVVNPVEYVKIGKNIIRLESPQSATSPPITTNQSVVLGIPNNIKVKMYNTHPKPIALPFRAKKIGGAILLSKQELSLQRNNLLMAISSNANMSNSIESYRTSLNNSSLVYKSNVLKNKNTSKSNSSKRSLSDKIVGSDNKQMKYSANLNGFLIHSTISETADAPSSNLTYLNMK